MIPNTENSDYNRGFAGGIVTLVIIFAIGRGLAWLYHNGGGAVVEWLYRPQFTAVDLGAAFFLPFVLYLIVWALLFGPRMR